MNDDIQWGEIFILGIHRSTYAILIIFQGYKYKKKHFVYTINKCTFLQIVIIGVHAHY